MCAQKMTTLLYSRRGHGNAENLATLAPATVAETERVHPGGGHLGSKHEYATPCDEMHDWPFERDHKPELLLANAHLGVPNAARVVAIADAIQMNPDAVILSAFICIDEAPRRRPASRSFGGVEEFELMMFTQDLLSSPRATKCTRRDDSEASSDAGDEDLLQAPRFKKRPAVFRR